MLAANFLLTFTFLCMKTDCLWKEGWQVGNAHIDHIDFALIFLFHSLLIKIGALLNVPSGFKLAQNFREK